MNENGSRTQDRPIPPPRPQFVDEDGPIPNYGPIATDPITGRRIPMSDEEREGRRAASLRIAKLRATMVDEKDTDEFWMEVYRSIDSHRPHRPLFEKWTKGGADSDS